MEAEPGNADIAVEQLDIFRDRTEQADDLYEDLEDGEVGGFDLYDDETFDDDEDLMDDEE